MGPHFHESSASVRTAGVSVGLTLHRPPRLGPFGPVPVIVRFDKIRGVMFGFDR